MDSAAQIVASRDIAAKLRDHQSALSDKTGLLSDSLARAVGRCGEELRAITATPLSFLVTDIEPGRLDDMPYVLGKYGLLAAYEAAECRDKLLIGLASDLIRIWVEALFGGNGLEHASPDERPCSTGERQAAQIVLEKLSEAINEALEALGVPGFAFERSYEAADAPARHCAAIRATLTMHVLGHQGTAMVGVPLAALTPQKPQAPAGKPGVGAPLTDLHWSKQIEVEIKRAELEVQAVIEEARTLAEVADLQVGQILPLQAKPSTHVKLECNGQALFWCELGQGDGSYIIRIHDAVNQPEEAHP
ncbi:MAG TPA: FliM/FliN family flagellar motor switch protein [Propylenella sp.]|nr:FliM/FliN family flagellar motor switch protein [Propylenella sp.]